MTTQPCSVCGASLEPVDRFCSGCGARVNAAGDTSTIPVPTALRDSVELSAPAPQSDLPHGVAAFVVQRGPDAGTRFLLAGKSEFALGRDSESDVFLDDVTVSRRHATVHHADGSWQVRDAGSLNGTYVNGKRAAEAALKSGDLVTVGKFHFTFHIGGQA